VGWFGHRFNIRFGLGSGGDLWVWVGCGLRICGLGMVWVQLFNPFRALTHTHTHARARTHTWLYNTIQSNRNLETYLLHIIARRQIGARWKTTYISYENNCILKMYFLLFDGESAWKRQADILLLSGEIQRYYCLLTVVRFDL